MRIFDYKHILGIVHQHFVLDANPPGALRDGKYVCYHRYDEHGRDYPCAIGVFDGHKRLGEQSGFGDHRKLAVSELPRGVVADVFRVDRVKPVDIEFLSDLQDKYDHLARHYAQAPNRGLFRTGLAIALEAVAWQYGLIDTANSITYPAAGR